MTNDLYTLYFDSITMDLKAANAKHVLKQLSDQTSHLVGSSAKSLFNIIWKQEQAQSSGIGNGVAIAHTKLPNLTRPLVIFAKLNDFVDFSSVDGEPVDLVCMVLSPEHEGPKHLSRLSRVTRILSNQNLCQDLRKANDADDIRIAMKVLNNRHLAAA